MEVVVHLLQGGRVALACQVMVGHSVSIAAMMVAPPSHVEMEGCALKRPVFPTSTASVSMGGQENGASRASECPNSHHCHAL